MPKQSGPLRFKVVVVGNPQCGKTLLCVALDGEISMTYWQNSGRIYFEPRVSEFKMGTTVVEVAFWDTSSNEDYARLRPLSYPGAHVILLCHSLTTTHPMEESVQMWAEEIRTWDPEGEIQFLVVGTKSDLDDGRNPVNTLDQGKWCAQLVGAHTYLECSSRTSEGIQELREEILRVANIAHQDRKSRPRRTHGCVIA